MQAKKITFYFSSVWQGIENPRVGGSIPPPGTTFPSTNVENEKLNGRLKIGIPRFHHAGLVVTRMVECRFLKIGRLS